MVYTVDMVNTVDMVDTVYTIQIDLNSLNSSWAGKLKLLIWIKWLTRLRGITGLTGLTRLKWHYATQYLIIFVMLLLVLMTLQMLLTTAKAPPGGLICNWRNWCHLWVKVASGVVSFSIPLALNFSEWGESLTILKLRPFVTALGLLQFLFLFLSCNICTLLYWYES